MSSHTIATRAIGKITGRKNMVLKTAMPLSGLLRSIAKTKADAVCNGTIVIAKMKLLTSAR